jgi:hypothetical protein
MTSEKTITPLPATLMDAPSDHGHSMSWLTGAYLLRVLTDEGRRLEVSRYSPAWLECFGWTPAWGWYDHALGRQVEAPPAPVLAALAALAAGQGRRIDPYVWGTPAPCCRPQAGRSRVTDAAPGA